MEFISLFAMKMNTLKLRQWLGIFLTVWLCSSCSTSGDIPQAVRAGVKENGVLLLTRADENRTAELRVGEVLEIRLAENPSTGFRWAVEESQQRLLGLENTRYVPPEEGGFIGARGQRIFSFIAKQPGAVVLKLKYWRVFEGDASVTERFTVTVQIVP